MSEKIGGRKSRDKAFLIWLRFHRDIIVRKVRKLYVSVVGLDEFILVEFLQQLKNQKDLPFLFFLFRVKMNKELF